MSKYLISADFQIGMYPLDPELEEDFYDAAKHIIKIAEENLVDGIILAGDIPDTVTLSPKQLGIISLLKSKVKIGLIRGNHDMSEHNWVKEVASILPNVYNLHNPTELAEFGLNPNKIKAYDYMPREELEPTLEKDLALGIETFILHQSIGELGAKQWADFCIEDMERMNKQNKNITYFCGDIHNYGDVKFGNSVMLQ